MPSHLRTGVCSVTFRSRAPGEVIRLARDAKLEGIEWGGDVHVPPGDLRFAEDVGNMTRDQGLEVSSYGSYFRCSGEDFAPIVETALALKAPSIRVWASDREPDACSPDHLASFLDTAAKCADLAADASLKLEFEWHRGTLFCESGFASSVLDKLPPSVGTYWQPPVGLEENACVAQIHAIRPWIRNVHVFHWSLTGTRLPLRHGIERWRRYLSELPATPNERWALLEFVRDDSDTAFHEDAEALHRLARMAATDAAKSSQS